MRRALLAAALLLPAAQAEALSCAQPDPAHSFARAQEAEESYLVLLGTFTFDPEAKPQGPAEGTSSPSPSPVPATFEGKGLTPEGFTQPLAGELELRPKCIGPWCGSLQPGTRALVFAEQQPDGSLAVELSACPEFVFPAPSAEAVRTVEDCMAGDRCTGPVAAE